MTDLTPFRLFSCGALRQPQVQQALFGRTLASESDARTGYAGHHRPAGDRRQRLGDPSDPAPHRRPADEVAGEALAVTADDLDHADAYEVADCARVEVTLKSGRKAFVYAAASTG